MIKIFHNKTLKQIVDEERFSFPEVEGFNLLQALDKAESGFIYNKVNHRWFVECRTDIRPVFLEYGKISVVTPTDNCSGNFINVDLHQPKEDNKKNWDITQYQAFLGKSGGFILRITNESAHRECMERYVSNIIYFRDSKIDDSLQEAWIKNLVQKTIKGVDDYYKNVDGIYAVGSEGRYSSGVIIPQTDQIREIAEKYLSMKKNE